MLSKDILHKLFTTIDVIEGIYDSNLEPIKRFLNNLGNYELLIKVKIYDTTSFNTKIEEKFKIEGIEEFIIKVPKTVNILLDELVIIKLDLKGIIKFPKEYYPSEKGITKKELEKKYLKFFDEKSKIIFDKVKKNRKKLNEMLETIKLEEIQEKKRIKNAFENKIIITPSQFYYINELVAELLTGGIWHNAVDWAFMIAETSFSSDAAIDYYKEWKKLNKLSNIEIIVETVLYLNGENYKENIVSLGLPCCNLINHNTRCFHNGVYRPSDKEEIISDFNYPDYIKFIIRKLDKGIESIPINQRKNVATNIIKQITDSINFCGKEEGKKSLLQIIEGIYKTQSKLNGERKRNIKDLSSILKLERRDTHCWC